MYNASRDTSVPITNGKEVPDDLDAPFTLCVSVDEAMDALTVSCVLDCLRRLIF